MYGMDVDNVAWRCNNNKRESCHTRMRLASLTRPSEGQLGAHYVGAGRLSGVVVEKEGVGRWPSLTQSNRYLGSLARLP